VQALTSFVAIHDRFLCFDVTFIRWFFAGFSLAIRWRFVAIWFFAFGDSLILSKNRKNHIATKKK
jgi:hypothetical protein